MAGSCYRSVIETGAQWERVADKAKCCWLVVAGKEMTINKGRTMAECSSGRASGQSRGSCPVVVWELAERERRKRAREAAAIRKCPAAVASLWPKWAFIGTFRARCAVSARRLCLAF